MRKFKLSALLLLCVLCSGVVLAQIKQKPSVIRCATVQMQEAYYQQNPGARLRAQQNASRSGGVLRNGSSYRLNAIVSIPVVIHVVLPNPAQITDADVNYLINRLNLDFSGLNPDSTNATQFYPVRGHSQIRFCLAKRTPAGAVTSGVERRASVTLAGVNPDAIKRSALGGLDSWDNLSYLNIWVGVDAGGSLGYAYLPGQNVPLDDGVFLAFNTFANNSCYTDPLFNLGRTGSHEVGHYLGLEHIWGEDGAACTGDDFKQLPGSCLLPTGLFNPAGQGNTAADVGDTPNQAGETPFTCPTGIVTDACATTAPGKMYQNYMDYTADACYSMFTNKQAARMEWVIDNCRPGLKTSLGCSPPVGFPVADAGINFIVSPGGSEFNSATCATTSYPTPTCPGSFIPRLSVTNFGAATITSITVSLTVGTTTVAVPFTVNLFSGASVTLAFPAQNLVAGVNTVSFTITTINGSPDAFAANNTITTTSIIGALLPFAQDFVTTTFPPPNMLVFNPTGTNTWVRNAAGNGTPGSAFINNYVNSGAQIDDIRTLALAPPANPTVQDSLVISFDLAHRPFSLTSTTYQDTLKVLVSTDCGATFTTVYSRWNTSVPSLATGPVLADPFILPAATDWRREQIVVGGSYLTSGPIIVAFRNIAREGNNIFLDNINIFKRENRDISISSIIAPPLSLCADNVTPRVVVANPGGTAVTSFRIGYRINAGPVVNQTFTQTIAAGASATVTLATATGLLPGAYTFTVFTADFAGPGGNGDLQTGNDTLSRVFTVSPVIPLPLNEGFETPAFPPPNWTLINPNNNNTWVRDNHGFNSAWSAKIDNYNFDNVGQLDALQTPAITTTNTDSIIVTFDVAHKQYAVPAGSLNDRLQVLASLDCGTSFASYYNKAGRTLATAGTSADDYVTPLQSEWRRERISIPSGATGSIIVRFQNTNDYGNNIFIDNINVTGIYKRDVQVFAINQPVICTSTTPSVTVRNAGVETITGFKVAYSVDNGAAVSSTFTGVSIPYNTLYTVILSPVTLAVGTHTIRVYSFDPVTATGTGDQNLTNDTLSRNIQVVPTVAAPLVEGFDAATFPPVGWALNNPDAGLSWQRTTTAARTGTASAIINNFNYASNGTRDELYTPRVSYSGVDSVLLSFDVAALTYSYPGSTAIPLDTLEILATSDCGATLTTIYKKWGNELQTVNDPNFPQTTEFVPNSANQWRRETINLVSFANSSSMQLIFRNTTNYENNIYLDNINLTTKTLPAKLKEQGYLIYPNPFTTNFTIQHYLSPTELRGVAVYNSIGQRVFAQTYGAGGASAFMQVDMSRYASGLYTVVLRYTNRTISQKIIKQP